MTALVAILNNQAVALAADSAVTTSGSYGQKIYETNKLFTLSKYHPVGIMVYSSASIMGVPVETFIKVYREEQGTKSYGTLQEYYDDFIHFIETDTKLFPEEARIRHCEEVINSYLLGLRDVVMRRLLTDYPNWGEPTLAQVKKTARGILNERVSLYSRSNELPGCTTSLRRRLKSKLSKVINYSQDVFKKTFSLSKADINMISELCLDLILKEEPNDIETGFVIAGFGEDEHFPQLRSFEIESSIDDIHKLRHDKSVDVSMVGAAILPFAQTEMVETFMRGRSIGLDRVLLRLIKSYFDDQKRDAANNPAWAANLAQIQAMLDHYNKDLSKKFVDKLREYTNEFYIKPILETIDAMPKEELALTAEALVNLTSIKRHISPDAETVGGPTDVAIISKGDGFIWIKRKHYFKSELNQQFSRNYYRGGKTS